MKELTNSVKEQAVFGGKEKKELIVISKKLVASENATDDYTYRLICKSPTGVWEIEYTERYMNSIKGQDPRKYNIGDNVSHLYEKAACIQKTCVINNSVVEQMKLFESFTKRIAELEYKKIEVVIQLTKMGHLRPSIEYLPDEGWGAKKVVFVFFRDVTLKNVYDMKGNLLSGNSRYNDILK